MSQEGRTGEDKGDGEKIDVSKVVKKVKQKKKKWKYGCRESVKRKKGGGGGREHERVHG